MVIIRVSSEIYILYRIYNNAKIIKKKKEYLTTNVFNTQCTLITWMILNMPNDILNSEHLSQIES